MGKAWQRQLPPVNSASMTELAYLFERFPSYTQTFCYREVSEVRKQGISPTIFSVRHPESGPTEMWDKRILKDIHYLPEEQPLVHEIERAIRRKEIPIEAIEAIEKWGRQTDFLRLYQAAYIGKRLPENVRLHAHFAGMAARDAYWIKQFFGVPFSFTAHANDIFTPRNFAIGLDRLVETATFVVTESDYAAKFLRQRFPDSAEKIHRVYNGLDLSTFGQADFVSPVPFIISVGRLIEKKGFADLIEAFRLLAEAGHPFRCEIIGDGPLEEALRAQIARSNLTDKISLAGAQPQEEIRRRLAAANVFVLACTTEASGGSDNLPTVIMEAMASGLPVVSTRLAGIPEMVESGKTGELVSPNEPRELADAVARFISNLPRAREFGAKGLELARRKFSIQTSVRDLLHLFEDQA